jgi:pimeloyl-ACP methyl ester carboxylesterase
MIRAQAKVLQFALLFASVTGQASATEPDVENEPEEGSRARGARCVDVDFSVALDPSTPEEYRIAGELCVPTGRRAQTLQILIHGASYNRHYWDFPYRPRRYSYVRHANDSGYATLAIDRLGSGDSDRPTPELVTVHASAYTIHQIVEALRSGQHRDADGHRLRFRRLVLVGHSFGSNISWTTAGIYGGVDGLILTGISHDPNPPGAPLTQAYAYPAQLDPQFAGLGLPPGYLTTIPGRRAELFYHVPGASQAVIDVDEATKDTLPVGMLFDQFTTYDLTQNIHVPVLNVIGNFDTLSCQLPSCDASGSVADEGDNYPVDAEYTQIIVPNAGHSLNLHRNAPAWYEAAQDWVHERIGR